MNKTDRFYFENIAAAAQCSTRAAEYLLECLRAYRPERLAEMLETMHTLEHQGDERRHEMSHALAKAFVTPVDREDLDSISRNVDDVTDSVEEILQLFYMDALTAVPPKAALFAEKLVGLCRLMADIAAELPSFKKPARLRKMIVELNGLEEECDRLYPQAVREIRLSNAADVPTVMAWRRIYDAMERCADACEHVADGIETVIMKNT